MLLFALCVLGPVGCESADDAPRSHPPPAAETPAAKVVTPVLLDLVADLPDAWRQRTSRGFGFADSGEYELLSSGWHHPQTNPQGESFAWTSGRDAVAELFVVEPEDRRLVVDVAPLVPTTPLPHQSIAVLWNGASIGSVRLDAERLRTEFELRVGVQRRGANRLDLLPLYWLQPLAVGAALDAREVGAQVFEIRLTGGTPQAGNDGPIAQAEGAGVIQQPGSVIVWSYALPARARLRGHLSLVTGDALASGGEGRVTLSLRQRAHDPKQPEAPEQILLSRSLAQLAQEGGVPLDLDLGGGPQAAQAGDFVSLTAAYSLPLTLPRGRQSKTWPSLRWEGLRIEGERSSPVPAGLPERRRADVLLVLFDTLRADDLEPYGAREVDTPEIERLAASGVTFSNAFANSSWTLPSVASILTGLYNEAHGVVGPKRRLPAETDYLPALLQAAGYRTLAVTNNAHDSSAHGFDRGYHDMHAYFSEREEVLRELRTPEAQASRVWDRFVAPARAAAGDLPLFVMIHEIDPHSPYQPPSPYAERYDFGYQGNIDAWITGHLDEGMRMLKAVNEPPRWLREVDLRYLRARYRGEVSFMDAYLGWLLDRLEAEGRRESTLVVFLSDHGEQFMEHGEWGHGGSLYEEELRVPLLFSLPGVLPEGRRYEGHAQLVDVAPTILDLLGLPIPDGMQGESLLAATLADDPPDEPRASYAVSSLRLEAKGHESRIWSSARLGRWKLLRRTNHFGGRSLDQYELYDLEADPEELVDRWPTEPVVGQALRQLLLARARIDRQNPAAVPEAVELDSDAHENLRALGYIE